MLENEIVIPEDEPDRRRRLRERLFGNRDRIGWWTLPVFLATALGGAVLAGSLATVYYGQQVGQLEAETAEGRAQLQNTLDEVEVAGQRALDAITEQVDAVRESLDRELPVPDALAVGVVHVRAVATYPAPTSQPPTEPSPAPSPEPSPEPTTSPAAQGSSGRATVRPAAFTAQGGRVEVRQASGLAVARAGGETFFVTSYTAVADPRQPGRALPEVEITASTGSFSAVAHSWDETLDLALYRAPAGDVPIPDWRPADEELVPGARLLAVGITPTRATLQLSATIAGLEPRIIVTDIVVIDLLRGGPLVDVDGRVVGITSFAYNPYGEGAGEVKAAVPIRVLCESLLRCASDDLAEAEPGTG